LVQGLYNCNSSCTKGTGNDGQQVIASNGKIASTSNNPITSGITSEGSISDVQRPYIIVGGWSYGDSGSQTSGLGASLGSASWEMIRTQADYKYGGAGLGAIKAEAGATIDIREGLNAGAMGSLVNGEVYAKVPIPFTQKSLKVGLEGHLFGAGVEVKATYGSKKELKVGASAIVGVTISLGIEEK